MPTEYEYDEDAIAAQEAKWAEESQRWKDAEAQADGKKGFDYYSNVPLILLVLMMVGALVYSFSRAL